MTVADYQLRWAEREFGPEHAAEIADIVSKYAKYNGIRKPDLLNPTVFSLVNYREAELFSDKWNDIMTRAQKLERSASAGTKGRLLRAGAASDFGVRKSG